MAKKTARINIALLCTTCNKQNYVSTISKENKPTNVSKFCKQCKKHTDHKRREKLK
ncbi:MAG: 50S ribosomal protein L33 [Candidatus Peribacteria bacterium]|nr:MAG: 50S ribosomal protein L33 [Candidatus Peribacteria bacterium]